MNTKETFEIFLKGILMGTADIIPGVSGGTIALITGIYERLIFGIRNIDFKFIPYLLKGNLKEAKEDFRRIDFQLFVPLLSGIGIAFLLLSKIIKFFLENLATETYAFFFGLILASAIVVYKHIDKLTFTNILFFFIGLLFAYSFVGFESVRINHSLIMIFFSGMIAICAMILPGISGAFILFFLNQYEFMLNALNNFHIPIIITFIIGAFIGIITFSRILGYLLRKYKSKTMSFLVGIMIGALRSPYNIVIKEVENIFLTLLPALVGFLIVFILEKTKNKEN